jgi:hypothetical protein
VSYSWQVLYAYVTPGEDADHSEELKAELVALVRQQVGAFVAPAAIHFAPGATAAAPPVEPPCGPGVTASGHAWVAWYTGCPVATRLPYRFLANDRHTCCCSGLAGLHLSHLPGAFSLLHALCLGDAEGIGAEPTCMPHRASFFLGGGARNLC